MNCFTIDNIYGVAQSGSCMGAASDKFCRVLHSTVLQLSHNSDSQSVNWLPKSIVVLFIAVARVAML